MVPECVPSPWRPFGLAFLAGPDHSRLLLDGHGLHLTLDICEYVLEVNIVLFCYPAHTTHLLQPRDVGLFGPLQHYYGKAVDTFMRETRCGILQGTFWQFYIAARTAA